MKNTPIHFLLVLFSVLFIHGACQNYYVDEEQIAIYENEIRQLKTPVEKDEFLADLFDQDQANRNGEESAAVILAHGYNSKEHQAYLEKGFKKDLLIFEQLKIYLEIHGFSEETKYFSERALSGIQYVAGHQGYKNQKLILDLLAPAYMEGHVSKGMIHWIIGEMHERKYGELFEVGKDRYTSEEEFDGLVKKLKLQSLLEN